MKSPSEIDIVTISAAARACNVNWERVYKLVSKNLIHGYTRLGERFVCVSLSEVRTALEWKSIDQSGKEKSL